MHLKTSAIVLVSMFFALSLLHAKEASVLVVLASENPAYAAIVDGFEKGMSAKGYTISKVETVLPEGSEEITYRKKSDLVFAIGTKAMNAAKKFPGKVPYVFCMAAVGQKGEGAGIMLGISPESKLKKIKEFMPGKQAIGMIYSQDSEEEFTSLSAAAGAEGLKVMGIKISSPDAFGSAFENISKDINVFVMAADSNIYNTATIKNMMAQSLSRKIPVVGLAAAYTKAGAVMSIEPSYEGLGVQSAAIASSILDGKAKQVTKVHYPAEINVSFNPAAARACGLDVSVKSKADSVFGE